MNRGCFFLYARLCFAVSIIIFIFADEMLAETARNTFHENGYETIIYFLQ